MKRIARIFFLTLCAGAAALFLLVFGIYLHVRWFPLSIETFARRLAVERILFPPAVVDGWGGLMTRALPLDDRRVAVGMAMTVLVLDRTGGEFKVCSEIRGAGIVHDLALRNGILYVAAGSENLAWYDAKDPCRLKKLGGYLFGGYGFGIHFEKDRLFLADRYGGLTVFRLKKDGTPRYERVRYGNVHAMDDMEADWWTNDVTGFEGGLAAADGARGLLAFAPDGKQGEGVREWFKKELVAPEEGRNIDPAPLRIRAWGSYLYAAMREKGVAVIYHKGRGDLEFKGFFRPDDGETLDLLVAGDVLFVPSTRGKVYAYDLKSDPRLRLPPRRTHVIGADASIHSLGFRKPHLYVSAVGMGLFQFHEDGRDPAASWRPPDEFRSVAKVGSRFVAALGGGGLKAYVEDGGGLREVSSQALPSFAFHALPLDDARFTASADLAGTYVFSLDERGKMRKLANVPTPEHAFSAAFEPPDRLATANGVYGLLRYKLDLSGAGAAASEWKGEAPPLGYTMYAGSWRGEFIGGNLSGAIQAFPETPRDFLDPRPARCFKGGTSDDGRVYALACGGKRAHVWELKEGGGVGHFTFRADRDVVSLFPDPPFLFAGGHPNRLTVYRVENAKVREEKRFQTEGTPYQTIRAENGWIVAGGRAGLFRLVRAEGDWTLEKIPLN